MADIAASREAAAKAFMSRCLETPVPAAPRTRRAPKTANPAAPREIQVVITPTDFDHRVDRLGRPYAWVRGTLTHRKVARIRTVMVQGEAYHLVKHLLGVGTSLKISGIRENIVDKDTGRYFGDAPVDDVALAVLGREARFACRSAARVRHCEHGRGVLRGGL